MIKKIFIARKLPVIARSLLEAMGYFVETYSKNDEISRSELLKSVKDKDAILCSLTEIIDQEVLSVANKVKIIANYAVGYDNIDISAATRRKIMVTNTPGVLSQATAEMAWALLLAGARRIVDAHLYIKAGEFQGWNPFLFQGSGVTGKTLGIIGAGRIGTEMALKSVGFNMPVKYFSRSQNKVLEDKLQAEKVDLDRLCKEADFISIHLPITSETRYLIQAKQFEMMKPTAYLINTGRGAVIDQQALIYALQTGQIAGAGLDVYEDEPEISKKIIQCPNVTLTPHIAASTKSTREKMAKMAANNIIAVLEGGIPPNLVNEL